MKLGTGLFLFIAVSGMPDTVLGLINICRMSEYPRKGAVAIGGEGSTP